MFTFHRLLERQLKRHKVKIESSTSNLFFLIESISKSYEHYEDSRVLVERAMEISNEELSEANTKLLQESNRQKLLIKKLKESIKDISVDKKEVDNNDILQIMQVLESEIRKRKILEKNLKKAKKIAEDSLKSKELFLANMSHEIRTPLNAILGMSWLMSKSGLTPRQKEHQEVIKSSAKNLLVIINDILDVSKISSGKFTLENINFNLDKLLNHLIKIMSFSAHKKGIKLVLKKDSNIQTFLKGDPTRLNQILLNLVGNAIKFTKKGVVKVIVNLVESKPFSDVIEFSVLDTGMGISDKNLKNIFWSFSQEDTSISRKYGGTGLGLTISKEFVKAFGGEIKVKSKKNKGSQFSFVIELEHISLEGNTKKIEKKIKKSKKDLSDYSILVVEDDEFNLLFLVSVLEAWSTKVEVAKNGFEAIEKLNSDNFDIILMDMHMPKMDGITATKEIRETLRLKTPIIALTADVIQTEKKCIDAGMNDFISKPFNPDVLYRIIKKHISK